MLSVVGQYLVGSCLSNSCVFSFCSLKSDPFEQVFLFPGPHVVSLFDVALKALSILSNLNSSLGCLSDLVL